MSPQPDTYRVLHDSVMDTEDAQTGGELATLKEHLALLDAKFQESIRESGPGIPPRWLNLEEFRKAPKNWDFCDQLQQSLMLVAPPIPDNGSHKEAPSEDEYEDAVDPVEGASMRVQAVLRSYFYNLDNGNLVTVDKVDESVAEALERVLAFAKYGLSATEGQKLCNQDKILTRSMSDEEGVVCELDQYLRQVIRFKATVCGEIMLGAEKILSWEKGARRSEEVGMCGSACNFVNNEARFYRSMMETK